MIGPTADEIVRMRWRVRVALRVLAALLLTTAVAWAVIRTPEFFRLLLYHGPSSSASPRVIQPQWYGLCIAMVLTAAAAELAARLGMGLLVPVPKGDCPRCGYELADAVDRCPECGLRVGRSSANHPG